MSWQISIPVRDRDQPLGEALASLPGALSDPEDRAVAISVMTQAMLAGHETVGQLLDDLESATPEQRRRVLDRARAGCGLPSTSAVDARAAMRARSQALAGLQERDEAGYTEGAICAEPSCTAFPLNAAGGPAKTNVRKWWCGEHRDRAAPGDMDPWSPRISFAPGGGIQFDDEVDADRRQAFREGERARARSEQRRQERQPEAEAYRRHQEALEEHFRPPKGMGFDQ